MNVIAPGSMVFHRFRGFGVLTAVNLLTGWVSVKFGDERRGIDLDLANDQLSFADGEPIRFRHHAPDKTPHARLMSMIREFHAAGYQRMYLCSWPNQSGMHLHWKLMCGEVNWREQLTRPGWSGCGSHYIFNPVMGWGDAPAATPQELMDALRKFDPEGVQLARGIDSEYASWFRYVCDQLLPNYCFSLENWMQAENMKIIATKAHLPEWKGNDLCFPPGWQDRWKYRTLESEWRAWEAAEESLAKITSIGSNSN